MKKTKLLSCWLVGMLAMAALLLECKKNDPIEQTDFQPPSPEQQVAWTQRANDEIVSLRNMVLSLTMKDSLEGIQVDSNSYAFTFESGKKAAFYLDNASYPAPLVGIHRIDNQYYWTRIIGTGTSATVLLKDEARHNYEVKDNGIIPALEVNDRGIWQLDVTGKITELSDPEGKPFRAIGAKALFNSVTFDIDSNATITTNEVPARQYMLPRHRPFTLLLDAGTDTLKLAAGFAIPVDFGSSGVARLDFVTPKGWQCSYEFAADKKSGAIVIASPTGLEAEYDAEGSIQVIATSKYGKTLERRIPVKSEIGLVNFASVAFTNGLPDITLTAATFTFTDDVAATSTKEVTAIKAGDTFRLLLPEGFSQLRKVTFTATTPQGTDQFDYYFPPQTILALGEQDLSIAPPKLLSYWQGGIVIQIDNFASLQGIERYHIKGKLLHTAIGPKVPWFPNGNINVSTANSDVDGKTNTQEIIKALGGIGTSANYIARWPVRITAGGYADWYLGASADYELFHQVRSANITVFDQAVVAFGGEALVEGTHNVFWTSTNINAQQAKVYDVRRTDVITTGTKIYGCYGLAFRNIN